MDEQSKIKKLTLIFMAITAGQMVLLSIAYVVVGSKNIEIDTSDMFLAIVPIAALVFPVIGHTLYKKKLNQIQAGGNTDKLSAYTVAFILKLALTEAATLIAIVAYFQSGNFLYLLIAGAIIFYFLSMIPSEARLKRSYPFLFEDKNDSFYQ